MRRLVSLRYNSSSGHVGLADQEKKMELISWRELCDLLGLLPAQRTRGASNENE